MPSTDLNAFRDVQRLPYCRAETVVAELRPGMSERETAALMKAWLQVQGVVE